MRYLTQIPGTCNAREGGVEGSVDKLAPRSPEEFYDEQERKQSAFFDLLEGLRVHPALMYTLLYLCGDPRIRYLCSVMPPQHIGM